MEKLKILVVEDDPLARKVLASHLDPHLATFAEDAQTGRRLLEDGRPDICFIDLQLGRGDTCSGLELIPIAARKGVYSVVMTGHDAEPLVDRAYALGCNDFYAKGNEEANVRAVLSRFLSTQAKNNKGTIFAQRFVTEDTSTRAAVEEALKFAGSDLPILLLGPSGTGKTSLAGLIHEFSARPGPFVSINCSAYTEDLLEAELFGYRKGAFTGANENRKGKLALAHEGTIFLDEVGSMSLKMQTKLLKAIEERSFYPLGAEKPETSRFRLISATLEDVPLLLKSGRMRFDFFQRIHGLTVELKPLSERPGDVLPLIASLTRTSKRLALTPEAKARLLSYDWPGNVREVKRFVDILTAGHEGRVTGETVERLLRTTRAQETSTSFVTEEQYRYAIRHGLNRAIDLFGDTIIRRCLKESGDRKTAVLAALKISTRLLYSSLMRRADLEAPEVPA